MLAVDATFINLLAELYGETGDYNKVLQVITQAEQELFSEEPLPPELQVTCHAAKCFLHGMRISYLIFRSVSQSSSPVIAHGSGGSGSRGVRDDGTPL